MPSRNLYNIYEFNHLFASPLRAAAKSTKALYDNPLNPFYYTKFNRAASASMELFERMTRKYGRPEWAIESTEIDGKKTKVSNEIVWEKPFCNLRHFKKSKKVKQEKLLIIAPMSGHYATLLRGTVQGTLPHFDVYISDWRNASNVPMEDGDFDLDDYIDYVIEMVEHLKGDCHVMAICQPVVPVAAAVAIMEKEKRKYLPKSMMLFGGPIDGRINPTMGK